MLISPSTGPAISKKKPKYINTVSVTLQRGYDRIRSLLFCIDADVDQYMDWDCLHQFVIEILYGYPTESNSGYEEAFSSILNNASISTHQVHYVLEMAYEYITSAIPNSINLPIDEDYSDIFVCKAFGEYYAFIAEKPKPCQFPRGGHSI